jgi:site-specific DNA-cytosine methylase
LHLPRCLYKNLSDLKSFQATNIKTAEMRIVPDCDLFAAGFSCRSHSKFNANDASFVGCSGTEETSSTWKDVEAYVDKAHPLLLVLENIDDCDMKSKGVAQSDAEYIVERLSELGYRSRWHTIRAEAHGSIADRTSLYLTGILVTDTRTPAEVDAALAEISSLLPACYVSPFPLSDFILAHDDTLLSQVGQLKMGWACPQRYHCIDRVCRSLDG